MGGDVYLSPDRPHLTVHMASLTVDPQAGRGGGREPGDQATPLHRIQTQPSDVPQANIMHIVLGWPGI